MADKDKGANGPLGLGLGQSVGSGIGMGTGSCEGVDMEQDGKKLDGKELDFELVYAVLNQAYDNYQKLCYTLIVHKDDYQYCMGLLPELLTTYRTIFSNEYRNFFYLMYRTAPAVLFYLMQFHDAREIFLGSSNIVVNYRLLEKLVKTSQEYEEAAEFIKNQTNKSNKSLESYNKFVEKMQDPDYDSPDFERLSILDNGQLELLKNPINDVAYKNINRTSKILDGRTVFGREVKKYVNDEMGKFNWDDLPKPKIKRYRKTDNKDDLYENDDDLNYLSLSTISQRLSKQEGTFLPQDAPVAKIPKKSLHVLDTERELKEREQKAITNSSSTSQTKSQGLPIEQDDALHSDMPLGEGELNEALAPNEQFFVSPMVNNNTFGVMKLLSNSPAFGPINANRGRNYDLPGLSKFQKKPYQHLTIDLKDQIDSLGSLIEKDRAVMARQLRRLSISYPQMSEIFGARMCLVTVNPNALKTREQVLEEFEQDCLIVHLGQNLMVRPAPSLLDDNVSDLDESAWFDTKVNQNFIITTGLKIKLNLQEVKLPVPKRHKSFALSQPFNIWKKQSTLTKFYEGIYRIEVLDSTTMPVVIDDTNFGPYDLIYLKL